MRSSFAPLDRCTRVCTALSNRPIGRVSFVEFNALFHQPGGYNRLYTRLLMLVFVHLSVCVFSVHISHFKMLACALSCSCDSLLPNQRLQLRGSYIHL